MAPEETPHQERIRAFCARLEQEAQQHIAAMRLDQGAEQYLILVGRSAGIHYATLALMANWEALQQTVSVPHRAAD